MSRRAGSPRPAGGAGGRTLVGLALAGAVLLALVSHLPLRRADYVQDDHLAVERNPVVARGDLREIFSTHYWAGAAGADRSLYRPVTIGSYALERRWAGRPDPRVSHAVNLALHVAATLSLLMLALRLGAGPRGASAAALLFAVHPVHVEAVANVVGRAEILAALFTLLALWGWSHAGRWHPAGDDRTRPWRWRLASWGAAAALFLALGSKESAIVAPFLLVLAELAYRPPTTGGWRKWGLERAVLLAPFLLAVECWLALRVRALEALAPSQSPHPMDNYLVLLDGTERTASALALVPRALGLLVFPVELSIDYSGHVLAPARALWHGRPLAGLLLLVGVGVLVLSPWIRRRPLRIRLTPRPTAPRALVGLAAALFLLPWLVVGNLLVDVGTIFGERLLYLPSVGFCLLAGAGFAYLAHGYPAFPHWSAARRERLIGVALVILIAAFSLLSWQRALDWRDDATVFRAAARAKPQSPRAWFMLAKVDQERGRPERAAERLERALALWPEHVPALVELGTLRGSKGLELSRLGRTAEAEQQFREAVVAFRTALSVEPRNAIARQNLGIALVRLQRLDEAERELRKALLRQPDLDKAWSALGHVHFENGRFPAAAEAYRRAVELGRRDLAPRLREALASAGSSTR